MVQMIAKTFHGLERVLANELSKLGASQINPLNRAVSFSGDKEMMYSCNLNLRTAISILLPINKFKAGSTDELYENALRTDWKDFFGPDNTFSISHSISSSIFNHSQYASLRLKDAICDHFRGQAGRRPSVNVEDPDVRINLHIYEDQITISLDSSGDPLFKRHYRQGSAPAPLNEVH
jgi:putative N6-adenine-specific DNA methylase